MKRFIITINPPKKTGGDYQLEGRCEELPKPIKASMPAMITLPANIQNDFNTIFANEVGLTDLEKIKKYILKQKGRTPNFRLLGEALYCWLATNRIGDYWRQYYEGNSSQEGLRTYIIITPPALRPLPWELLKYNNFQLCAIEHNPIIFVRGNINFNSQPPKSFWPIKTMAVVGLPERVPAAGAAKEEFEDRELVAIEEAFKHDKYHCLRRSIDCHSLIRVSRKTIIDEFEIFKPHIFHFIGHGKKKPGSNEAMLEIVDENKSPQSWPADDITTNLANVSPRIVFVNSCRSADIADQENNLSIIEAFTKLNIPAVIGMQVDVQGRAALIYTEVFYRKLAEGRPIDCAIAAARKAVGDELGYDNREWIAAVLHLTIPPEMVLPIDKFDNSLLTQLNRCDELKKIRAFVDRKSERRSICNNIEPTNDTGRLKDLMVILGEKEIGKTWLIKWTLEYGAMRQHQVIYVDANIAQATNFLDLLRFIKGDFPANKSAFDDSVFVSRPIRSTAFNRFNHELNSLMKCRRLPGDEPIGEVVDEGLPWCDGDDNLAEEIFKSFRQALTAIAQKQPLIIALDHLNLVVEQSLEFLYKFLILPILDREISNVRLIIGVRDEEYQKLKLHRYEDEIKKIKLNPFDFKDIINYAREYCRYNNFDEVKTVQFIKITTIIAKNSAVPPAQFEVMKRLLSPN